MLAFEPENHQIYSEFFDGPLELLLYLVRRQGVPIHNLKLSSITDSYLSHLNALQPMLHLNSAGDFLYMASTLCFLKSKELLKSLSPSERAEQDELEDEFDGQTESIRASLIRQLIEYRRYQEASEQLALRPMRYRDTFGKNEALISNECEIDDESEPQFGDSNQLEEHVTVPQPLSVQTHVNAIGLMEIYRRILNAQRSSTPVIRVQRSSISINDMAISLLSKVPVHSLPWNEADWSYHYDTEALESLSTFTQLVKHYAGTSNRIVCLITVLELARHNLIEVHQFEHLASIYIWRQDNLSPEKLEERLNNLFNASIEYAG